MGWPRQFPLFHYFSIFQQCENTLATEYHVYNWQVLPQFSCSDACQIWMWLKESNRHFCKIENFTEKLINRALVTPTHGVRTKITLFSIYMYHSTYCISNRWLSTRLQYLHGLALLTLSWDKNWDSHSLVNGYPSFYPRIALVAPSPEGWNWANMISDGESTVFHQAIEMPINIHGHIKH